MTQRTDGDEQAGTTPERDRPRRRPGPRWLAGGVAAVVVALVVAYAAWWTQPTTFGPGGNGYGFRQTTATVHPVTVDMVARSVDAEAETITVHGIRPRVVTNTADARVTFAVCRRTQDSRFMAADGRAERVCEDVADVEGQQVRLTPDITTTIAMTVTPRHAGRVEVEGMQVDYGRGAGHLWQRGSEETGPDVTVVVRR